MTLKDAASDVVGKLNGQTLGSVALVSGTNLFSDWVYPFPTMSVHVLSEPGDRPEPFLHPTATAMFHPTVNIIVYAPPGNDGHDAGEALARGIMGYLQQAAPTGYVSCLSRTSAPTQTIEPETDRVLFSMTFDLRYQP